MLPDASASSVLVIGEAPAPELLPARVAEAGERADLVVVAPTRVESRRSSWLAEAARIAEVSLSPDGAVYVLAPRGTRRRLRRLLERHGLVVGTRMLHLPDVATSRFVIPLVPAPARYALRHVLETRPWKRRVASLAVRARALALAGRLLEPVALVGRRPGARPLYEWLDRAGGDASAGVIVVSRAARSARPAVVLLPFARGAARPTPVAKVRMRLSDRATLEREADVLARLGPVAAEAGAEVPRVLASTDVAGRLVLLESALTGTRASRLLGFGTERLEVVLERLVAWLESWARATATATTLREELLVREIVAPADLLAPLVDNGARYASWIRTRCEQLVGATAPLVATHNDLTMSNVLFLDRGRIGIVDWESAREHHFPLVDFLYAAADGVAAAEGYKDRVAAFETAFAHGGTTGKRVAGFRDRLAGAIDLSPDMADLCFHACWLHHARNEHLTGHPADKPFLQIVRRLASSTIPDAG